MAGKEYALYKGETLQSIGTLQEIAEKMNISVKALSYYRYPSYQKRAKRVTNRRILVPLDEEAE